MTSTDMKTVPASVATLKVLEAWGVDHIYGYPGGSFSSTMNALDIEKDNIDYIQIRQEQVGAFAASADFKLTGKIGVAFGSAGPGATNLLTGLYDAKEDHAPVLALVGQVASSNMNYDWFQEFPEDPMFADVAIYNRTVMTPESLPYVVDKAIREAYKKQGVAVVVIPNDFGFAQIPDVSYSSVSPTDRKPKPMPEATDEEVDHVLEMIKNAKRPIFHVGRGIGAGGEKLVELAKKLQIPITHTALATGLIDDQFGGDLGAAMRVAMKASNEFFGIADLAIVIGADFPFGKALYGTHPLKFVQVDANEAMFGRHHHLDYGVWSDATSFVEKMLERSIQAPESGWYQAAVADNQNWREYLEKMMTKESDPLQFEAIYNELNNRADSDAIYAVDTGDNTINVVRYLHLTPQNKWTLSALFASMGYGLPASISAALNFKNRQVFNIAGDGAFSMVIHDLVTQRKYHLPIINIVTANETLGFIKSEQADEPMDFSGIDLEGQDFAMIANGMGVESAVVTKSSELKEAFDKAFAAQKAGRPFVIDARITDKRSLPVEDLIVRLNDGKVTEVVAPSYDQNHQLIKDRPQDLREFFDSYDGQELQPITYFLDQYNVDLG